MIRLEIWGPYASFNRPELKVERYSYDFITPSAARNILQSIYWHPSFDWVINKIYICNPIVRMRVTRNEMKNKGSYGEMRSAALNGTLPPYLRIDQTQRSASILKNVRYVIEASFVPTGNEPFDEQKIYALFCKRAKKGKCFHQPVMGTREFPAHFRLLDNTENPDPVKINQNCGIMLYDIDFSSGFDPYYFNAVIEDGIVDLEKCEVIK